jgi:hypothetical protein
LGEEAAGISNTIHFAGKFAGQTIDVNPILISAPAG